MSTPKKQSGVVKRRARAESKRLVQDFIYKGLTDNYGEKEIRQLQSQVPRELGKPEHEGVTQEIQELIGSVSDILYSNGRGNTRDRQERRDLAHEALSYIENYTWTKYSRWYGR